MKCIKSKVNKELAAGNIGSNHSCEYHPCHYKGQNCSFCFCPFYPCNDPDLGRIIKSKRSDNDILDCSQCLFCHNNSVVEYSYGRFRELGITDADDPRIRDVMAEAKAKYFRKGKTIMILGATSDAGKSVTVAAICRIINRMGYSVSPFKSQNMSLNSKVTRAGHEISMIQDLQCKAAGTVNYTSHVNPILLKPKGDSISQVIVEGVPFGDYDVEGYYNDFIPSHGFDIVRSNVEFLRNRYDYVVMEGAGSPMEINIYDKDIANMRAAEIAEANCILVINMEWGGSFAYAVGTVELMPEEDRKRIKGIILNNVRGKIAGIRSGAKILEKEIGIPVIGIIPHLDVDLPKEDSECFRDTDTKGSGRLKVSVIRLPRISNFTDIDPLSMEDVTIRFVKSPEQLAGSDAIIIPGTKNTMADLDWLCSSGMADAIKGYVGKIPILGICGGYQMMAKDLYDPNGIEDKSFPHLKGLGLFDTDIRWDRYDKRVVRNQGHMLVGDCGEFTGYEIHMGMTERNNEKPLFRVDLLKGGFDEGSVRLDEKLFGTYQHGVFERPAFRRFFISQMVPGEEIPEATKDYSAPLEENLDILADSFEKAMDMKKFKELFL